MCVLALAAAFCAVALKKYAPETSAVIAVAAAALIALYVLGEFSPLSETIRSLSEGTGIQSAASVLIKTVGICALAGFTSDACRDTGNSSLASKVEFAAKLSTILISLPMFENILSFALSLLGHKND